MSKPILKRIWNGLLIGLKWTLIQYAVLLSFELIVAVILPFIESLICDESFRELLLINNGRLGLHGFYTFYTGCISFIPIASLLFGLWYSFMRKSRWTFMIAWVIHTLVVYLLIAARLNWQFRIITFDSYMAAGILAPLIGASIQLLIYWGKHLQECEIQEE